MSFEESLRLLETLGRKVYELDNSFRVPACIIHDFMDRKVSAVIPETSYPPGFFPYNFKALFPAEITEALKDGFLIFRIR